MSATHNSNEFPIYIRNPQTNEVVAIQYVDHEPTDEEITNLTLKYFPAIPLKNLVQARIKYYRLQATELLTDMYADNTLAGITVQQSDVLFDEFMDVIYRIQQGAFPTALYRLSQKTPSGFVTQTLLDSWSTKIRSYL